MNHTLVFAKSNALAKVIVYKSCDELCICISAISHICIVLSAKIDTTLLVGHFMAISGNFFAN